MSGIHQMLMAGVPFLLVQASNVVGSGSGFASSGSVSTTGSLPNPTIAGGTGSYTYQWSRVGAAAAVPFNVSSPTSTEPTWSVNNMPEGEYVETWKLEVVDTVSGAKGDVTISVTLSWANLS
jgi:hypothetical protein